MPIKILTPEVVSRIAAGEVVERPASVVKELVENSLDAGASQIDIETGDGGASLIRVVDNGVGISSGEVELAFQRYATSKVSVPADLQSISSLGFRGEALPSIAAVAQVEILTRTAEELAGTYLSLRGGVVVERGRQARNPGTTLTIRHLFRDVPARLKFLKSKSTENSHISNLVSQFSLAFPEVRFSLIVDGRRVLHTPGSGNLRDAVAEVYALDIAQAMLEVRSADKEGDSAIPSPQVAGLVCPPSLCRASRNGLSLFVNRRWVRSPLLARAVEDAYQGLVMEGKHPIAVIELTLPPQEIDINVHPAKMEVKFRYEAAVFSGVHRAVRRSLAELMPIPDIKPGPDKSFPQQMSKGYRQAELDFIPSPRSTEDVPRPLPVLRVLGQLASVYIIAEGTDGLYLIDQHAAHERVLFEKILAQRAKREIEVQGLLQPATIEFAAREEDLLRSQGEFLAEFGFEVELFGPRTYLVRTVPAIVQGQDVAEVVRGVLDLLARGGSADWEEKLATSLACHSAVRAGQVLSDEEMRELVRQLEGTNLPRTCPHGRPTMVHLSSWQLAKEFGRG
jgi:DNA mismatch repair protein MutL